MFWHFLWQVLAVERMFAGRMQDCRSCRTVGRKITGHAHTPASRSHPKASLPARPSNSNAR